MADIKAKVKIQWMDSVENEYDCSDFAIRPALIWLELTDGEERNIPLLQVRWYSVKLVEAEVVTERIGF